MGYMLNDNIECDLFFMIFMRVNFYHTCNLTLGGLTENISNKHLSMNK